MIARTRHGVTPSSKADAYFAYLKESGLKAYRDTPGNRGVLVLRRTDGDRAHFLLVSLWDSIDSIRRFAGPNLERAVYYPRDKEFLLELEPTVTHYEVLASPGIDRQNPPASGAVTEAAIRSRFRGESRPESSSHRR